MPPVLLLNTWWPWTRQSEKNKRVTVYFRVSYSRSLFPFRPWGPWLLIVWPLLMMRRHHLLHIPRTCQLQHLSQSIKCLFNHVFPTHHHHHHKNNNNVIVTLATRLNFLQMAGVQDCCLCRLTMWLQSNNSPHTVREAPPFDTSVCFRPPTVFLSIAVDAYFLVSNRPLPPLSHCISIPP